MMQALETYTHAIDGLTAEWLGYGSPTNYIVRVDGEQLVKY